MTQYYTINAGDSLWKIAQKFNTTVDELVRLNYFASSNVTIHPGQRIQVKQTNSPVSSTNGNTNLNKLVQWFKNHQGKITHSMINRFGPNTYDCSSAVFSALIYAGFLPKGTWLGNTESLFALENKLLIPIKESEARFGDIFVSGVKGYSNNDDGHTGIFTSNTQIIHCDSFANGITETALAYGKIPGKPTYYYRIRGGKTSPTPTPQQPKSTPTPHSNERVEKEYAESGKFTANRSIAIRNEAKDTSSTVATLNSGESVNYDKVVITNKYVYISYISYSGTRRYVAIRTMNNGQRGQMWGAIV